MALAASKAWIEKSLLDLIGSARGYFSFSASEFQIISVRETGDDGTVLLVLSDSVYSIRAYLTPACVAELAQKVAVGIRAFCGATGSSVRGTLHSCPHPYRNTPDVCLVLDSLDVYGGFGGGILGSPKDVSDSNAIIGLIRRLAPPDRRARLPELAAARLATELAAKPVMPWQAVVPYDQQAAINALISSLLAAAPSGGAAAIRPQQQHAPHMTGYFSTSGLSISSSATHVRRGLHTALLPRPAWNAGSGAAAAPVDEDEEFLAHVDLEAVEAAARTRKRLRGPSALLSAPAAAFCSNSTAAAGAADRGTNCSSATTAVAADCGSNGGVRLQALLPLNTSGSSTHGLSVTAAAAAAAASAASATPIRIAPPVSSIAFHAPNSSVAATPFAYAQRTMDESFFTSLNPPDSGGAPSRAPIGLGLQGSFTDAGEPEASVSQADPDAQSRVEDDLMGGIGLDWGDHGYSGQTAMTRGKAEGGALTGEYDVSYPLVVEVLSLSPASPPRAADERVDQQHDSSALVADGHDGDRVDDSRRAADDNDVRPIDSSDDAAPEGASCGGDTTMGLRSSAGGTHEGAVALDDGIDGLSSIAPEQGTTAAFLLSGSSGGYDERTSGLGSSIAPGQEGALYSGSGSSKPEQEGVVYGSSSSNAHLSVIQLPLPHTRAEEVRDFLLGESDEGEHVFDEDSMYQSYMASGTNTTLDRYDSSMRQQRTHGSHIPMTNTVAPLFGQGSVPLPSSPQVRDSAQAQYGEAAAAAALTSAPVTDSGGMGLCFPVATAAAAALGPAEPGAGGVGIYDSQQSGPHNGGSSVTTIPVTSETSSSASLTTSTPSTSTSKLTASAHASGSLSSVASPPSASHSLTRLRQGSDIRSPVRALGLQLGPVSDGSPISDVSPIIDGVIIERSPVIDIGESGGGNAAELGSSVGDNGVGGGATAGDLDDQHDHGGSLGHSFLQHDGVEMADTSGVENQNQQQQHLSSLSSPSHGAGRGSAASCSQLSGAVDDECSQTSVSTTGEPGRSTRSSPLGERLGSQPG